MKKNFTRFALLILVVLSTEIAQRFQTFGEDMYIGETAYIQVILLKEEVTLI